MSLESIDPREAADRIASEPQSCCYLDVRTVTEFAAGHPEGAWNLPLHLTDPVTGQMTHNPEFTTVAQRVLDRSRTFFVGCASGKRSLHAVATLSDFGFRVVNVTAGFSGQRSPAGELVAPGWCDCDLPVEGGEGGDRSWSSLRER